MNKPHTWAEKSLQSPRWQQALSQRQIPVCKWDGARTPRLVCKRARVKEPVWSLHYRTSLWAVPVWYQNVLYLQVKADFPIKKNPAKAGFFFISFIVGPLVLFLQSLQDQYTLWVLCFVSLTKSHTRSVKDFRSYASDSSFTPLAFLISIETFGGTTS